MKVFKAYHDDSTAYEQCYTEFGYFYSETKAKEYLRAIIEEDADILKRELNSTELKRLEEKGEYRRECSGTYFVEEINIIE